jgi:hypothetical protein
MLKILKSLIQSQQSDEKITKKKTKRRRRTFSIVQWKINSKIHWEKAWEKRQKHVNRMINFSRWKNFFLFIFLFFLFSSFVIISSHFTSAWKFSKHWTFEKNERQWMRVVWMVNWNEWKKFAHWKCSLVMINRKHTCLDEWSWHCFYSKLIWFFAHSLQVVWRNLNKEGKLSSLKKGKS